MTSTVQQGPEAESEPGAELPRRAELSRWETLDDDWWQAVPMRNLQKWQELQGEIKIELQPTRLSDWFQAIFVQCEAGLRSQLEMAALPMIRVGFRGGTRPTRERRARAIPSLTILAWCGV